MDYHLRVYQMATYRWFYRFPKESLSHRTHQLEVSIQQETPAMGNWEFPIFPNPPNNSQLEFIAFSSPLLHFS